MLLSLAWPAVSVAQKAPAANMAQLVIDCMEDGAKVYLNKKLIGKTPFEAPVQVRPGKYKVEASKPGFTTFEQVIVLKARQKLPLSIELMPYSGLVKFTCNVEGAEVYVGGKLLGQTPLIKDVLVGNHKIVLVKEGFNDFATELSVQAGQKHFVDGVLTPFEDFSDEVKAMAEAARLKAEQERLEAEAAAAILRPDPGPAASWTDTWYKEWWVWTLVGAVVVTAVAVPVALTSGGGTQSGLNDHEPAATISLPLR
jgi:hypothetical protein